MPFANEKLKKVGFLIKIDLNIGNVMQFFLSQTWNNMCRQHGFQLDGVKYSH